MGGFSRRWICLMGLVLVMARLGDARLVAQSDPLAPEMAPRVLIITSDQAVSVFAGPGNTYEMLGTLDVGIQVIVRERNQVGNWLHVTARGQPDGVVPNGWTLTGYFTAHDSLILGDIPVNTTLPDADLSRVADPQLAQLYALPVIPAVSDAMRSVYERGRRSGNFPNVITKVGDSISADPLYLVPMSLGDQRMGPYDYLEPTLQFFGPQTQQSVAAVLGFNTFAVLDPFWSDPASCAPNESPLECEYRHRHPSIVFIMFGPNDLLHFTRDEFEAQMRLIVEDAMERGIIPVLSTFSYSPDRDTWPQALEFNLAITRVADDYNVPIINLWAAARPLPDYGLEGDFIHMKHWGFRFLKYDAGEDARYGLALRNLLSIRMLDELRRSLRMDARYGDAFIGRMGSARDSYPSP